jgi:hypothetical protein
MAYQTGTATDIGDLVSKLFTFATGLTTTPWTSDELDIVTKLQGTMHRGNCYVSFRWDSTVETDLGLYQSLGWVTSKQAHEMTDDSGNGDTSVPINTGRRVNFGSTGPFTAYHFFASEGSQPCIYVVVEVSSGVFRHFGFGNIKKFGTWTGGEFVYGHTWDQGVSADNPGYSIHSFLLDGIYSGTSDGATIHAEGLDSQGASEKWAQLGSRAAPAGTDTAGEDRQVFGGGSRCGFWGNYLATIRYSSPQAFKPLITIPVIEFKQADTPDTWIWMGEMVDICICNMHAFTPGQSVTVGTDTWMVFPWVRKRYEQDDAQESWNAGVAYKKVI